MGWPLIPMFPTTKDPPSHLHSSSPIYIAWRFWMEFWRNWFVSSILKRKSTCRFKVQQRSSSHVWTRNMVSWRQHRSSTPRMHHLSHQGRRTSTERGNLISHILKLLLVYPATGRRAFPSILQSLSLDKRGRTCSSSLWTFNTCNEAQRPPTV